MYCKSCGQEIPGDANLCPYCGSGTGELPQAPPIQPPPKKSGGKTLLIIVAIVAGLTILICGGCLITGTLIPAPDDTTSLIATTDTGGVEEVTEAPVETAVPTGVLTPTPRPLTPSCSEILQAKRSLTDAQWDVYTEDISGTWVESWSGSIREVGDESLFAGGYPVYVDISTDCDLYFVVVDEQTAISFAKGQPVSMTGRVDFVSVIFGLVTLHLDDNTVEIQ